MAIMKTVLSVLYDAVREGLVQPSSERESNWTLSLTKPTGEKTIDELRFEHSVHIGDANCVPYQMFKDASPGLGSYNSHGRYMEFSSTYRGCPKDVLEGFERIRAAAKVLNLDRLRWLSLTAIPDLLFDIEEKVRFKFYFRIDHS